MSKINFLTRWKSQLLSFNSKVRVVALFEMVEMINNLSKENQQKIYVLLINSDICHFMSEIISYRDTSAMGLINKIVCHLSETVEFFKNDFFKVFKGYLRAINSFPLVRGGNKKHQTDIFTCVNILFKRARYRDCNFNDPRMNFSSIIGILGNLHAMHYIHEPVLNFLGQVTEVLIKVPAADENDKIFRNSKLQEIIENLNMRPENLESLIYTLSTAKLLQVFLSHVKDQNEMGQSLIAKFLALMEFSMKNSDDEKNYEVFCNIFYYFLTTDNLENKQKLQLLNLFFTLDGHNIVLLKMFTKETSSDLQFKSRVVFAEVMRVFLCHLSKTDEDWNETSYEVVFKGTGPEDDSSAGPTREEAMLFIFLKFIDFSWKKQFDKVDVFTNSSLILAVTEARKEKLNPTFFNMLVTLYTSTFENLTIKGNQLLEVSSKSILDSVKNVTKLNLSFMKWWTTMAKPQTECLNQVTMKLLSQETFQDLKIQDCEMFDKEFILKTFLDPSTCTGVLNNLTKVLCVYGDSGQLSGDFDKLLTEFENLQVGEKKEKVMDVIVASAGSIVGQSMKEKAAAAFMRVFEESSSTQHEKIAVSQAATILLRLE